MEKELSRILIGLREKSGILVQAISSSGEHYASTFPEFEPINEDITAQVNSVYQADKRTYFKFNFGGEIFYGVIMGDSVVEKNYANLIIGYIEFSENKPKQLSYDEQLNLIVTGNSTKSRTLQFINDYSLPKTPLYVMLVTANRGDIQEVQEFLSDYFSGDSGVVSISNDSCACIRYVELSDASDLLTPVKQAETLSRSVFEELGAVVSVYVGSTVRSFLDVSQSYAQAVLTKKASEGGNSSTGVFAYKDYLLDKIFEEIPSEKLTDILNVLSFGGEEILKDKELLSTGDCFLKNDLNVSETAREMYIHRNTLIYRLEKIEKLTGLDVKKFSDALNFKILYIISKINQL